MSTAEDAILYYEAGQNLTDFVALSDSGDHKIFNSAVNFWSMRSGYVPDIKPNGLINGGAVTPAASGSNDKIDVAEIVCSLAGVETTVTASADEDIVRGLTTDTHRINSVTVTSAGAIAIVSGAEHTAFSETRGADGGPPWIPTGSIEIAQVRLTSIAAAVVTADEIKSVPNTHVEWANYPVFTEYPVRVSKQVLGYAGVTFNAALPLIHSDDAGSTTAGKKVYAKYYEPEFAEAPDVENFLPPKNSHSVNSKQVYGRTLGSRSASLGQGSFTIYTKDGITDNLLKLEDEILMFKFYQDQLKPPYIVCQGALGVKPSFPAGDLISSACTISADSKSEGVAS